MANSAARKTNFARGAGPVTKWEPDAWTAKHVLVCRLHAIGLTGRQIAVSTGYTEARVSIILNDSRAEQFIREAVERVGDQVLSMQAKMQRDANRMYDIAVYIAENDHRAPVRLKAAFGLLDRAGYTPVQRHTHTIQPTLPSGLADAVRETHAEYQESQGKFQYEAPPPVDAEFEELDEGEEVLPDET